MKPKRFLLVLAMLGIAALYLGCPIVDHFPAAQIRFVNAVQLDSTHHHLRVSIGGTVVWDSVRQMGAVSPRHEVPLDVHGIQASVIDDSTLNSDWGFEIADGVNAGNFYTCVLSGDSTQSHGTRSVVLLERDQTVASIYHSALRIVNAIPESLHVAVHFPLGTDSLLNLIPGAASDYMTLQAGDNRVTGYSMDQQISLAPVSVTSGLPRSNYTVYFVGDFKYHAGPFSARGLLLVDTP